MKCIHQHVDGTMLPPLVLCKCCVNRFFDPPITTDNNKVAWGHLNVCFSNENFFILPNDVSSASLYAEAFVKTKPLP